MQKKCYKGLGIFWQTEPGKQKTKKFKKNMKEK